MLNSPKAGVLKRSLRIFSDNDPLRLAGATAFFTTFALPAVLFLILLVLRLVLSPEESNHELFASLSHTIGEEPSKHLFNVLKNFERIATEPIATAAGVLFLIFVATTLFKVIKNSLNDLWDIQVTEKMSLRVVFATRSRELLIIFSAGILLLLTLFLEGVQMVARQENSTASALLTSFFGDVLNVAISIVIVTGWFGIIFCYLPDARVPLKIGFTGALLTSVLFNAGRILLRYLLFGSNINQIFGASAAVVLLLLFVFYSSFIFYFGAAFTKALANSRDVEVKPLPYASHYVVKATKNE